MKYKVGDKVKFVENILLKDEEDEDVNPIGREFVIDFIEKIDSGVDFYWDKQGVPFLEEELELVERGENIEHTK